MAVARALAVQLVGFGNTLFVLILQQTAIADEAGQGPYRVGTPAETEEAKEEKIAETSGDSKEEITVEKPDSKDSEIAEESSK